MVDKAVCDSHCLTSFDIWFTQLHTVVYTSTMYLAHHATHYLHTICTALCSLCTAVCTEATKKSIQAIKCLGVAEFDLQKPKSIRLLANT